jgi:uncharacterized protein YdhG (YjbR/CyaY superfamily)
VTSKATTVDQYIKELPVDRVDSITKLRNTINKNLPKGFEECISYGMIGWVVPFKLYPKGYHCDPKLPLPFLSIASQKNFVAVYHMGIYADSSLLNWFTDEFAKTTTLKLDMGKSCIRFKKPDLIPFDLIGQLCKKMTPGDWINAYERALLK